MPTITLTSRQLSDLVTPVIPHAGTDDMLPVINAVLIESDGKWLTACATDRFRVGFQRIEKVPADGDESINWPPFKALIPLDALKSILAQFKASRHITPDLTLTVDGPQLVVEAAGGFMVFDAARLTYRLLEADFPNLRDLLAKEMAAPDEQRSASSTFNPMLLASFKGLGRVVRVRFGAPTRPALITNDDGFIGLLMPRRPDCDAEDWSDLLTLAEAKAA